MPDYLMQFSYAPEALAALVASPQNREEAAQSLIESLGGIIKGFWYAFGDYDAVIIAALPDNVKVVAISMAAAASGDFRIVKTTPLLSVNEGMEAMKIAAKAKYKIISK